MNISDYIVIIFYFSLIGFITYLSRKNPTTSIQNSPSAQYLANNELTFWESFCSIIATEVSALTFLGIPAFAFKQNFSFLQIYIGAILGRLFIAKYFIPQFFGKGLTLYEILNKNNPHRSGQPSIASFFLISKVLAVGVRLFSGSILVAQFLHLEHTISLILITTITFLYTLVGGLKAVVRTDIFQMVLFIVGGICAHIYIPITAQSDWIAMMTSAFHSDKLTIFDWQNPHSILAGICGGILFDLSTHGVDQDFAQRLMATKTKLMAQKAIFFSSFMSIAVGALFLGVGALLWVFYQSHPLPASVPNPDHLFAYFIVNHFPDGLRGLMVAGVIAATMSTLDSTINALSACISNDIFTYRKFRIKSYYFIIDNIFISLALLSIAILTASSEGLLMLGLKIQSWTAGSLLALFVSKIFLRKIISYNMNFLNISGAYLFGCMGVYLNTFILEANWNWNVYFGFIFSISFLYLYSKLNPE